MILIEITVYGDQMIPGYRTTCEINIEKILKICYKVLYKLLRSVLYYVRTVKKVT